MNEDDDLDYSNVTITEDGAARAQIAINLYARGFSADDIYDIIGLPELGDDIELTKEQALGVFMFVARSSGALD